jgi:glycosyltransferase involved in cell wall biosynthesis
MVAEVSIVLSSFNGARYLREQMDSLLGQTYSNILIQVRDDGSSDKTAAILREYSLRHPNVQVTLGERLGVARSFFQLLKEAGGASEYFAFCDQDDVWYPKKTERAISRLSTVEPDMPALYCSRLEYVDSSLNHLGFSRIPTRGLSFGAAFVENSATGCTVVMNRAARDLVVRGLPEQCIMHDWWCYLVVAAFGVVIFDEAPGLKYRLHAANDTGAAVSPGGDLARRARRFWRERRNAFRIHAQAQEFAVRYASGLANDKRDLLDRFLASNNSLAARIRYALKPGVHRQSRVDDLMLRALIVLGWY